MNVKLRNRRAVEAGLKGFLENVVIPPAMVTSICGGEVNDAYLEYVVMLNSRLHYATNSEPPANASSLGLAPSETVAAHELLPDLERLRLRAVAKVVVVVVAAAAGIKLTGLCR